jgi:chemotaxis protein histidine kinase CheA
MAFVDEFKAEADEHLRLLDELLLALERDPNDPRPVRQMFLSAHTIKGGAAMVGFTTIRNLAHATEDVLARLRDERRHLDGDTADLLFKAVDMLRELLTEAPYETQAASSASARLAEQLRAIALPRSSQAPPPQIPQMPGRPRILLVESSPTIRMLEATLLTDAGFDVDAVGDGKEALAMVQSTCYHLVITGGETKGLRGVELAQMVLALPGLRDTPIILMTTDDRAESQQQAAGVGIRAYIRRGSYRENRLVETAWELVRTRA